MSVIAIFQQQWCVDAEIASVRTSRAASRVIPAPTNSDIASSKEHSPPFCFMQTHSVVKPAFLLPLEARKKTAGKNSQPFLTGGPCCNSSITNEAISAVRLQPFKPED
jgi:hypothetical protein